MEELQDLIKFLKDKGLKDKKIDIAVFSGIIEYFANNQQTKKCDVSDGSISNDRAEKYGRHQHYLGTQGRDLVELEEWRVDSEFKFKGTKQFNI